MKGKRFDLRFQVLTATSKKMTAFRDIKACTLVEVNRYIIMAICDDGGSKHV
jgi:hypothetical protein